MLGILLCLCQESRGLFFQLPALRSAAMEMSEQPSKKARVLRREASADASLMLTASSRVTLSKDIVEGTLLPVLAKENLDGFTTVLPTGSPVALGRVHGGSHAQRDAIELSWGSCCSGSEGAHYVIEACNKAMAEAKLDVKFRHSFSCENNKAKQKWIANLLGVRNLFDDGGASPEWSVQLREKSCIFEDIKTLGDVEAGCCRHGKLCTVPSVDCLLIGTSCKDLSRANSSVDRTKLVLSQETSRGASAQTFRGMLAYCKGHRPGFVIFENVDSIDDKVTANTETNLSLLMGAMKDLGYEGQKVMTDAQEFGLPCRRRRLYVLFLDTACARFDLRSQAIGRVFAVFRSLVSSCLRSPPCSKTCMLERGWGSGFLTDAFENYQSAAEKNAQKKQQPQNWIDKHMAYAESIGYRWGSPVAPDLEGNQRFKLLTKREADALMLSRAAGPTCEFRNLSQSVGRINSTSRAKEVAPTMLPGQILWVESKGRLLTGFEALMWQGFPVKPFWDRSDFVVPDECESQNFLHDLAGNAMALPVVLAIFQSALAAIPWADSDSAAAGSADDVNEALAALAVLTNSGADVD